MKDENGYPNPERMLRQRVTGPERCRCHSREGLEPGQHENDCPLVSVPERPTPPDDTTEGEER